MPDQFIPLPLEQRCQFGIIHLIQAAACKYHHIQWSAIWHLAKKLTRYPLDSISLYGLADILLGYNQTQTVSGATISLRQEKQIFVESLGIRLIKDFAVVLGIEKAFGFSKRGVKLVTHPTLLHC